LYADDDFPRGFGVEEPLNTTIIDAATGEAERPPGSHGRSRYVTPIANLPLICHVFDELARCGVRHARIVAGAAVRVELERTLDGGRASGVEVSYVTAPDSDGRHALFSEIEKALSAGPVLVHPGDCLFPGQIAAMRDRFSAGDIDLVLLADGGENPLVDPPPDAPGAGRVCDTAVILGPATRHVLAELLSSGLDGPDLIESLLASDGRVAVCELADHWRYSDSTEALLTANRIMLDSLVVRPGEVSVSNNNRIHGRVAIGTGAQISNSTIRGPVAIGERAVVEDSFIGPYTAIGLGAVISGAEIDNTIVHAAAEIRHPGYRIEASIIGERASIARSFELPKGLHMRLEPDSSVMFS
jgi:glucose-1-phosphate thymidylyltransferase